MGLLSLPSCLESSTKSEERDRDRIDLGHVVISAPAVAVLAGTWHSGDHDLRWQPETEGSQGVSVQPEGSPRTPICPLDAVLCVNSASLAPFLSYFMHPDAHQGQDLRTHILSSWRKRGNSRFTVPLGKARKMWTQELEAAPEGG